MLSPPDDLALPELTAAVTRQWGVTVAAAEYRPAGFGSHHWAVADRSGGGWFLTVDDLDVKRRSAAESRDEGYARLRQALGAARAVRDLGERFVVAPLPTAGGDPLARVTDRYAAALYPLLTGDSFEWGPYAGEEHRNAVLNMVIRLHTAPPDVRRAAADDDLTIQHRDALRAALDGAPVTAAGPYADRAAELIADHAEPLRDLLARYDDLVARADPGRAVLTHGEPHAGNTMHTADGWRLIDWDTARVAPPERDLWLLGGDLTAYTEATGVAVLPEMLELFRLRWEITDLAIEADRFRRPHTGSPDDEMAWTVLQSVVAGITG